MILLIVLILVTIYQWYYQRYYDTIHSYYHYQMVNYYTSWSYSYSIKKKKKNYYTIILYNYTIWIVLIVFYYNRNHSIGFPRLSGMDRGQMSGCMRSPPAIRNIAPRQRWINGWRMHKTMIHDVLITMLLMGKSTISMTIFNKEIV